MPSNGNMQSQFDAIIHKIVDNKIKRKKTKFKQLNSDLDVLVHTVTLAGDCTPTKKSKTRLKGHIRELAVSEANENIARENF